MTRWLVTGGCGFIGSHFLRLLLAERPEAAVCNLDALTYAGRPENVAEFGADPRYRFVKADVADAAAVEAAFGGFAPDVVVHFAAETHVDRSLGDAGAFVRTNALGTQVLLAAARRLDVKRFVQVSTDEVYGSLAAPARAAGDAPLAPSSPYAASKAAADLLVLAAVHSFALPAVITRGANTYGPNQFPEKLLPLAIANALAREPIPLYGDGGNERDWLYVEDHCRGVLAAAERGCAGAIYNLGGSGGLSNRELLERLLDLLERPRELIRPVPDRPGHDRRYALDSTRARRELGWEPQVALDAGLRRTVEWYGTHAAWLAAVRDADFDAYYRRQYGSLDSSRAAKP
ncbi:MAG: dTDP-glucose 4,6-dehydratase [Terriglobales bacterium]